MNLKFINFSAHVLHGEELIQLGGGFYVLIWLDDSRLAGIHRCRDIGKTL